MQAGRRVRVLEVGVRRCARARMLRRQRAARNLRGAVRCFGEAAAGAGSVRARGETPHARASSAPQRGRHGGARRQLYGECACPMKCRKGCVQNARSVMPPGGGARAQMARSKRCAKARGGGIQEMERGACERRAGKRQPVKARSACRQRQQAWQARGMAKVVGSGREGQQNAATYTRRSATAKRCC